MAACLALIQGLIGGTRMIYGFFPYAVAGVAAVLSLVSLRRPSSRPSLVCLSSTLLLAGYVLLRAWGSPNDYLARTDAFMAAACLIVYLLTALYLTEARPRIWVVLVLLAVALVHAGVGAYQFKTGSNFMLFGFDRGDTYGSRASGLLICPNHTACYFIAVGLLGLSITVWSRFKGPIRILTGYLALLCLLGLAITQSRGGYLSAILALGAFAGLSLWTVRIYNPQHFSIAFLVTLGSLVLLLGTAAGIMMESRAISGRIHQIGTASEDVRWYNWLATIDQFKSSPLLGTGAGTHLFYGRLYRRPQLQSDPIHSHGDYLQLLAEYGIVGGVLAAAFLASHIRCGVRTARQVTLRRLCNSFDPPRSDTLALTLGSLGAVTALLAHSVVDFNMHIPGNALLFAFIFGMLSGPGADPTAETPAPKPELLFRGGVVLAGISLLTAIACKYPGEKHANDCRNALNAKNFPECIRLAEMAIENDPANFNSYFYQGEANRVLGANMTNYALREASFLEAIAAYRAGLKYFPQDESFWVRLGQCLDATYQFDDAEEAYRNAINADPALGILYSYYGAHWRLVGEEESAQKCEDTAHALCPNEKHEISMGEPPSLLKLRRAEPPPSPK